jgi:ankyrin repeat protein
VRLLLQRTDVIPNRRDFRGRTALIYASSHGSEELIKLLLQHGGGEVDAEDEQGNTALFYAASGGQHVAARLLLDNGAFTHRAAELKTATRNGQAGMVELLLAHVGEEWKSDRWLAAAQLFEAVKDGDVLAVQSLVEKGADIEGHGAEGLTPLGSAFYNNQDSIVRLLLGNGADVNHPRTQAVLPFLRSESTMRLLLENGVGLAAHGKLVLRNAAYCGSLDIVRLLLANGVDAYEESGDTALHCASRGFCLGEKKSLAASEALASLLLANGANVMARDLDGATPLHLVRHASVARLLVEKGAMLEVKDKSGWTPLYRAARSAFPDVVRVLLELGADPYGAEIAKMSLGYTTFDRGSGTVLRVPCGDFFNELWRPRRLAAIRLIKEARCLD